MIMQRRLRWAALGCLAAVGVLAVWWMRMAALPREQSNETLRSALATLESAWKQLPDQRGGALMDLQQQVRSQQVQAGNTEVTGQGLRVTLSDAPRSALSLPGSNPNWMLVHDNDLLRVINGLRAGGAQALAVSGVRLTATTAVRCGGPSIQVGGNHLTPPFIVEAVGDPEDLERALWEGQPSLAAELRAYGLELTIEKVDMLILPMAPARESKFATVKEVGP